MIKFSAVTTDKDKPERPILGIGLTEDNCAALLAGMPIHFSTEGMDGLPLMDVFIMGGQSEEDMAQGLLKAGLVEPEQVRTDPTLADPHVKPSISKHGVS